MEAYLPDHPEKCIPKRAGAARFGGARRSMAWWSGRSTARTTAGRSPARTSRCWARRTSRFTDDGGEYRFRFDMSLVDNCRTQYVRVTAPGYESRLLVLMVGPNVRSDDVLLKKR